MKSPIAFRPRDKTYEIPPKWWFPLVKILTAYGLKIDGWEFQVSDAGRNAILATKDESRIWLSETGIASFILWFRETIEGQDTRPVPRAPTAKEILEAEQQVEAERANWVAVEEKEGL